MIDLSKLDTDGPLVLSQRDGVPEQVHVFEEESRLAIKGAVAAGRPLLVRGEPGVGKTQLAAATACALECPLISFVVDGRTESRDLLWQFDSVRRLAEAQLCGALSLTEEQVKDRLTVSRFTTPGPLWWGFDWQAAAKQQEVCESGKKPTAKGDPANGRVVLIDEIDKADTDVPNGLLEALGSGSFTPLGFERVMMKDPSPIVIITTNEERVLPDAFIRRCLVLELALPDSDDRLIELLISRGRAHFSTASENLLSRAAQMLVADRRVANPPLPGQAEYLDLVRAVTGLVEQGVGEEEQVLERLARFTYRKQSGVRR